MRGGEEALDIEGRIRMVLRYGSFFAFILPDKY